MSGPIEYIVSGFIYVLLIFTILSFLLPTLSYRAIYTFEGQLQLEADKIVNQMLLNPGDPSDWGITAVYPNDIRIFGLALNRGEAYELDANKLIRIYENQIENLTDKTIINTETIAKLLGIYGRYMFSIRLMPALNITTHEVSEYIYKTIIKTHEGIPVPNVKVRAIFLTAYIDNVGEENATFYVEDEITTITNYKGEAFLNFTSLISEVNGKDLIGWALIIYADFYGMKSISIFTGESDEVFHGIIIGDDLYVGYVEEILNITVNRKKGAIFLYPAAALITPDAIENIILSSGKLLPITPGSARPYYKFSLEGLEDKAIAAILVVKNRGSYRMVIAQRAYNNLEVGAPSILRSPVARGVHIRRVVTINGFMYYFDFTMWRVVEEE